MAEVEIISMLMPVAGQRLEDRGGHARVRLHARPDEAHPRDVARRCVTPLAPRSPPRALAVISWLSARSSWGTVKEMSVTPCSDVFCTIMSTLTSASASEPEQPGGDAGLVGHARRP